MWIAPISSGQLRGELVSISWSSEHRPVHRAFSMIGQAIDVTHEAHKLGNVQMTNVVLLGELVKMMPFFEMEPMRNLIE